MNQRFFIVIAVCLILNAELVAHASSTLLIRPNAVGTYQSMNRFGNLLSGAILSFPFEEGTGSTTSDASGTGNTGTLGATIQAPTWTTGKYGNALSFDGSNDFVQIADSASLDVSGFTIACWIYPSGNTGAYRFISSRRQGGQTGVFYICIESSEHPRMVVYNTGYQGVTYSGVTITQNTWQFLVYMYNNTSGYVTMYLNQNTTSVSVGVGNLATGASIMSVGIDSIDFMLYPFAGKIDNFQMYNRPLTSSEIASIYNGYAYGLLSDSSDATGVQTTTSTSFKEMESFTNHTTEYGMISTVTLSCKAKTDGSTSDKFIFITRTHNQDFESVEVALTTSFSNYSVAYALNPISENAWTWSDIDALKLGMRASTLTTGKTESFTDMWIIVTYTYTDPDIMQIIGFIALFIAGIGFVFIFWRKR